MLLLQPVPKIGIPRVPVNKAVAVASRQGIYAIIFVRCSPGLCIATSQARMDKNILSPHSNLVPRVSRLCLPWLGCLHSFSSYATLHRNDVITGSRSFKVVCSVTWPLNGSEAGGELVLIQTSLFLFCKSSCFYALIAISFPGSLVSASLG